MKELNSSGTPTGSQIGSDLASGFRSCYMGAGSWTPVVQLHWPHFSGKAGYEKGKKKRTTDVPGAEQKSIDSSVKHLKKSFQTCEGREGKCTLAFSALSTGTRAEQNWR